MTLYLTFKTLHILFMVSWFAGIFYLPRLFVYHAESQSEEAKAQLAIMEKKLFKFITPLGLLALLFGLMMGFLGSTKGGDPVPMRDAEINKILGRVDEMALTDENVSIPFIAGETVKVIDGPFNSFNAEIESIDEQKKKLKLIVKIFGRKTPLELNFMQVEKI